MFASQPQPCHCLGLQVLARRDKKRQRLLASTDTALGTEIQRYRECLWKAAPGKARLESEQHCQVLRTHHRQQPLHQWTTALRKQQPQLSALQTSAITDMHIRDVRDRSSEPGEMLGRDGVSSHYSCRGPESESQHPHRNL